MAIEDVIAFLKNNQGKFSEDELIAELQRGGYPEQEIRVALAKQQEQKKDLVSLPHDFSIGKKIAHIAAGFFGAGIFEIFFVVALGLLGYVFLRANSYSGWDGLAVMIFWILGCLIVGMGILIFFVIRWWKKHSYIAYGILSWLLIGIGSIILRFSTLLLL